MHRALKYGCMFLEALYRVRLVHLAGALTDSFDIAKWADDQTGSPPAGNLKLFPAGKLEDIKRSVFPLNEQPIVNSAPAPSATDSMRIAYRYNAMGNDMMAYTRGVMNEKLKANPVSCLWPGGHVR